MVAVGCSYGLMPAFKSSVRGGKVRGRQQVPAPMGLLGTGGRNPAHPSDSFVAGKSAACCRGTYWPGSALALGGEKASPACVARKLRRGAGFGCDGLDPQTPIISLPAH